MQHRHANRRGIPERNALIEANQGLVYLVAVRYCRTYTELELDDIVSIGQFGLIRAAEIWDETRDVRFSTYATASIRGAILSHYKLPRNKVKHSTITDEIHESIEASEDTSETVETSEYHRQAATAAALVDTLDERDRLVIRMRFGLGCEPTILSVIGDRIGLSKERVNQLKRKAIVKLRERAVAAGIGGEL